MSAHRMSRRRVWLLATVIVGLPFMSRPAVAAAQTITVTTTDQHSSTACTLSDAITAANLDMPWGQCPAGLGSNTIHVPAGEYVISTPWTPGLGDIDSYGVQTGLPHITRAIRLTGDGPGVTVIRRDENAVPFRLFKFQAPFVIQGMTLKGGNTGRVYSSGGGAILIETFGWTSVGGARLEATVKNVTFEDNHARRGGALADSGFYFGPFVAFTVEDTVFTANVAMEEGGGIFVSPNSTLNLQRSRFADNDGGTWGGGVSTDSGSPVPMEVTATQFLRNRATEYGGAIYATSPRVTRSEFRGNTLSNGRGGALFSYGGRPVIKDSTFVGNQATRGGAIEIMAGSVEIEGSTFSGNTAHTSDGGALFLDDRTRTSRITNSTFSGNLSASRGAITLHVGAVTIVNSTIVHNTNTAGGWSVGVSTGWYGPAEVFLSNTIVAGNTSGGVAADLYFDPNSPIGARLVSLGHNVIGSNLYVPGVFTQSGDQAGTMTQPLDPGLLALADNGGPTWTHALRPASPALDAGSTATPGTDDACMATDQRGLPRPGSGTAACDIGAFEHQITFPLSLHVGMGGSVAGLFADQPCVGACIAMFGSGSVVTLVAQPSTGTTFVGWLGGACEGSAPVCAVTMSGAETITATFRTESAASITVLQSATDQPVHGQQVTLIAVVSAAVPATVSPSGDVMFVNTTPPVATLGWAPLQADGTATLSAAIPRGGHVITAIYSGDGTFTASSGTVSQLVHHASTTVSLTQSGPSTTVLGAPVAFTAQVAVASPGAGTPTGTVTISAHNGLSLLPLGTASLSAGSASLTTRDLALGLHQIQVTYSGDASFAASSSAIIHIIEPVPPAASIEIDETVLVDHANDLLLRPLSRQTTTVLSSSATLSRLGRAVTFTLTVAPASPSLGIPTGEVIIVDASTSTTLGTIVLNGTGTATLVANALTVGSHSIVATYQGDATFTTSYGSITQEVKPPIATAIVLTSTVPSSVSGQPVTFTAQVTSTGGETFTPSGRVKFVNATTGGQLGTSDLNSAGMAQVTVTVATLLPVRTSSIKANYEGDDDFNSSTISITQVVARALTRITIASSAMPAVAGRPVTFTAVVAAVAPGAGNPTGTVSFFDTVFSAPLGTVALTGAGTATITTNAFTPGIHLINAGYTGDARFAPSDGSLPQTVNAWPTLSIDINETVVVDAEPSPSAQNTPLGSGVVVQPAGGASGGPQITLTFAQVTAPGQTTAVATSGPPPPGGFKLTAPPTIFDITSTASFSGMITVCIVYPAGTVSPRLMHFEAGGWVDRTTTVNAATRTVCGQVSSLSPFAVFTPAEAAGRMSGDGATSEGHEFDFRVAERTIGVERGALVYTHKMAKTGREKARTVRFRASAIDTIVFWDDSGRSPARRAKPAVDSVVFTGTGSWNGAAGYTFEAEATDSGEPGRGRDTFTIVIRDPQGAIVVSGGGVLTQGNIQSQRLRNHHKGEQR